ncbi:MAG TPA: DUF5666 domain-containing protein [Dongiaceae bacterium]|jgi:hypothetical protein|nr:DUF5666 domain-containing protein [Dongiaceae bacterium]
MKRLIPTAMFAATVALAGLPASAESPVHLRGEIDAVTGQSFEVTPFDQQQQTEVDWNQKTRFASLKAAQLSDIKQGMFVGTAALPQPDGTLKALEIHIFPDSMRGTGEGYRPFPQVKQGTMTNATVTNIVASSATTTNGGKTLTLTYKDGHQTVVVPPDAPIVLLGPGDSSMLTPHSKVSVTATKNAAGKLTATRLLIGLDGATPPI